MVTDWDVVQGPKLTILNPAEVIDEKARLEVVRNVGNVGYMVIADADGPVHSAILLTGSGGCGVAANSMKSGNAVYRVYDDVDGDMKIGGAIGGSVDELRPRVYLPKGHRPSNAGSQQYDIGRNYFIEELGGNDPVYSLTSGTPIAKITVAPEDRGMIYADYRFNNDDIFWVGAASRQAAVKVWTLSGGTKTLVGWPGDYTRVAMGFATDGVDMVWMEANDIISEGIYADYQVWTAKYSTDPAVVAATKRHLFPDTLASFPETFVVGCGYAAIAIHAEVGWGIGYGFRVFRISDGWSWIVQSESFEQLADFIIQRPLLVTCNEVFARAVRHRNQDELVRVRIDSLGPGMPPG